MPIKIRYNKQVFEVPDSTKTVEQLLTALALTNIVD